MLCPIIEYQNQLYLLQGLYYGSQPRYFLSRTISSETLILLTSCPTEWLKLAYSLRSYQDWRWAGAIPWERVKRRLGELARPRPPAQP